MFRLRGTHGHDTHARRIGASSLLVGCKRSRCKGIGTWSLRAPDLELGPFLALRLRFNEGSTFGLLPAGSATWLVAGIVVFVVVFVAVFGWWFAPRSGSIALGAALVSAGGTGNLADRWFHGRVTDFVAIRLARN